jgi:hypothetical protein
MLIDVATLVGVFAAGYGLRAWISTTEARHEKGSWRLSGSAAPVLFPRVSMPSPWVTA